jgi:hypothetical protein
MPTIFERLFRKILSRLAPGMMAVAGAGSAHRLEMHEEAPTAASLMSVVGMVESRDRRNDPAPAAFRHALPVRPRNALLSVADVARA